MLQWVRVGASTPRLEVFGDLVQIEPDQQTPTPEWQLVSLRAVRFRNAQERDVLMMLLEPFSLPLAWPLTGQPSEPSEPAPEEPPDEPEPPPTLWVTALPQARIVFEGLEAPLGSLLNLVRLEGWKLVLEQRGELLHHSFYFFGDWDLSTHPDHYPGAWHGEASFIGPDAEGQTVISVPWPLSSLAQLELRAPVLEDGAWTAALFPGALGGLLDSLGEALAALPLAGLLPIDPALLPGAVEELRQVLSLRVSLSEARQRVFQLRIALPAGLGEEGLAIAELAGQTLRLRGGATFSLTGVIGANELELGASLELAAGTGFALTGPLISALEEGRRALTLLSEDPAALPSLALAFTTSAPYTLPLASCRIPTWWEAEPSAAPLRFPPDLLNAFEVQLDGAGLHGMRLASMDGLSPRVSLTIERVQPQVTAQAVGFELELTLAVASLSPLRARWGFALDLERLAFVPSGSIQFEIPGGRFDAFGLHVHGLTSASIAFIDGQLSISATDLVAYYTGVSSPEDRSAGFELAMPRLRLGPAGVDAELTLTGGAPRVIGIGEAFKAVEGRIVFAGSRLLQGYLRAFGPLPWLDNATGSLTLLFRDGLELDQVKAEFQLGLHGRAIWWFEVDLKTLSIELDRSSGRPVLLPRISGSLAFKPPGDPGNALARFLTGVRMDFTDLVLTRAFTEVPPSISMVVGFHKPKKISLFDVFQADLRSVAIVPGSTPGEAAIKLGCQVFFSSADLLDLDIELHDLKLEAPEPGSFVPRVTANGLAVRFRLSPVEISGYVDMIDEPDRKGFDGGLNVSIENLFGIGLRGEMVRVRRPSDGRLLRVWSVYGEVQDLNLPILPPIFLRDAGAGFGWRKTLAALDSPELVLEGRDPYGRTAAPHLKTSWVDDLEGEDARWTFVLASWVTVGLAGRGTATPLAGDLFLTLRSDLTILAAMRGWFMQSLQSLKQSAGSRPAVVGRLLINPRRRHFLAEYSFDTAAAVPEGVPSFIASAFLGGVVPFALETRPGFFRLELAWPRALQFPMGLWNGRAGFMVRGQPTAITIGLGFEMFREFSANYSYGLFGGEVFLSVYAYLGFWGEIITRIGAGPALWGAVGVAAILRIGMGFRLRIKLGWIKITISISIDLELSISARLELGISGAGIGFVGECNVRARIWRFGFSASVRLAINGGAVDHARNAVLGASAMGGMGVSSFGPPSLLPDGTGELPELPPPAPRWSALAIEKHGHVYVLLLPARDAAFATPAANPTPETEPRWPRSAIADYAFEVSATGLDLSQATYLCQGAGTHVTNGRFEGYVNWSAAETPEQQVGDRFARPWWMAEELRLVQAILEDARYRPGLMTDWRVRAEDARAHADRGAAGLPPDVRSSEFSAEDSLYDLLLEQASAPREALSWTQIAVGLSRWREHFLQRDGGQIAEEVLAPEPGEPAVDPALALLRAVDRWDREQSGLSIGLLQAFRDWLLTPTQAPAPLLAHAGVAFKLPRTGGAWSLTLSNATVRTRAGADGLDVATPVTIEGGALTGADGGLGFGDPRRSYRVSELIELQNPEGLAFSWLLECVDENQARAVMSPEVACGLASDARFAFFDHFEVVRTNLSRDEAPAAPVKVRPGFLPVLAELGGAAPAFRLLAPRFELTDSLEGVASPGEVLLYRITAIDTFAQRSLTLEHVTTRRELAPPPAPRAALADYSVRLTATAVEQERLLVTLREPAAGLRHELYLRSYPLGSGGYYGFGDNVDDDPSQVIQASATDPVGMVLVATLLPGVGEVAPALDTPSAPSALAYGHLHELYVRAVSAEGATSRLVRCEHRAVISAPSATSPEPRSQPFLERIPAPHAPALAAWVLAEDLRVEARPAPVPRPGTPVATELEHVADRDPAQRQVVLRFLHERALDAQGAHSTGGYEVYVRDRDATIGESGYQRLAQVEVIDEARFRAFPRTTEAWQRWTGSYLRRDEPPAFRATDAFGAGEELGYLFWGDVRGENAVSCARIPSMPEEGLLHVHLELLLWELGQLAAAEGRELLVSSTPPTREHTSARSLAGLFDDHPEDKDPNGAGLLAVLGRSVELFYGEKGAPAAIAELAAHLRTLVEGPHRDTFAQHVVTLEQLLQSDRSTPLTHVRLSLAPRLIAFPELDEPARTVEADRLRAASFERFVEQLAGFGVSRAGALEPDSADRYLRFVRRFLRQRPLTEPEQRLAIACAYYEAGGSSERPLSLDDTVAVPLYYKDDYARRFAYRVRRLSRYALLLRELGLWPSEVPEPTALAAVVVRLPRVKPPAAPAVRFLGHALRGQDVPLSEWLIEEHEEEAMVQANETLRNRLGFRGLAFALHAELDERWLTWSGWQGEGPPLPQPEAEQLAADATWPTPALAPPAEASLGHAPFSGLLLPKGTVVRVPRLPYYYRYRLGAFARADDLDSPIKLSDAAQVVPERVPRALEALAGWRVVRQASAELPALLELWWRVPSVWDSLDEADRALWPNEQPRASRLWDFDLEFSVELARNQVRTRLLGVRLAPERSGPTAEWAVITGGAGLYGQHPEKVETLPDVRFPDRQLPELRLQVAVVRRLEALLVRPEELVFDLITARSYGRGLSQRTALRFRGEDTP